MENFIYFTVYVRLQHSDYEQHVNSWRLISIDAYFCNGLVSAW